MRHKKYSKTKDMYHQPIRKRATSTRRASGCYVNMPGKNLVTNSFLLRIIRSTSVLSIIHMRKADNPQETKSFDLLWKWMEITTGAQREHRYDVLVKQATEKGVSLDSIH